jgi:RHS repeat-associated protein
MQLSSGTQIPDGLLADIALRNEKPRLGVPSKNPALHQGIDASNSTIVLGLQSSAALNRIGSRSTGKERDTESGLDYFGARYYGSSMGRFMSPDWSDTPMAIPYGDLENPQSLNMYAYVNNNPLSNVDDDGHATDCGGGGDKSVVCLVTSAWDWLKSHLGGSGGGSGSGSSNGDVPPPGGPDPNRTPQLHTRPAQTPGTVNNQQFANWMNNNAQDHSTGRCAAYCRQGLEAGGLNTAGHPVDAKNYGPFLLQHGYHVVQDANYFGNQQVGDIAVFQPAPGHSQSGHIETWTGSGWVSDFKQNRFSPYHGLGPSDLDYKIYRQH